ncbi:glycosyltransferase family 1 protein [Laccaria amethystina LaAM-08-1]|jgi:beta-1,4-N-acetylglucosaminyltransferase|uniref:UDP-N-acetylglucosamine transferase subunit ALG13 n=1 Tax=Laccaria amethystina LaAM-08-1 TaxID=1095629 RepID=A0A0C9XN54_9AGAR|nr:glycosyltransferase family 1 protein [Laccaria amethystina LaAM-08-1]
MLAFVTVGSTQFDSLIQSVLSEPVLLSLRRRGYMNLILQCGNSQLDLARCIETGNTERVTKNEVDIEYWKFKPSLQEEFEKADLVISHAGSGTILDVLRLGKAVIVVPNPTLLDRHQEELAKALSDRGYLKAATISELPKAIAEIEPSSLQLFPPQDKSRFAKILDEEMGF